MESSNESSANYEMMNTVFLKEEYFDEDIEPIKSAPSETISNTNPFTTERSANLNDSTPMTSTIQYDNGNRTRASWSGLNGVYSGYNAIQDETNNSSVTSNSACTNFMPGNISATTTHQILIQNGLPSTQLRGLVLAGNKPVGVLVDSSSKSDLPPINPTVVSVRQTSGNVSSRPNNYSFLGPSLPTEVVSVPSTSGCFLKTADIISTHNIPFQNVKEPFSEINSTLNRPIVTNTSSANSLKYDATQMTFSNYSKPSKSYVNPALRHFITPEEAKMEHSESEQHLSWGQEVQSMLSPECVLGETEESSGIQIDEVRPIPIEEFNNADEDLYLEVTLGMNKVLKLFHSVLKDNQSFTAKLIVQNSFSENIDDIRLSLGRMIESGFFLDWLRFKSRIFGVPVESYKNCLYVFSTCSIQTLNKYVTLKACLPLPLLLKKPDQNSTRYFFVKIQDVGLTDNSLLKITNEEEKTVLYNNILRWDDKKEINFIKTIRLMGPSPEQLDSRIAIERMIVNNHIRWGMLQSWIRHVQAKYFPTFSINAIAQRLAMVVIPTEKYDDISPYVINKMYHVYQLPHLVICIQFNEDFCGYPANQVTQFVNIESHKGIDSPFITFVKTFLGTVNAPLTTLDEEVHGNQDSSDCTILEVKGFTPNINFKIIVDISSFIKRKLENCFLRSDESKFKPNENEVEETCDNFAMKCFSFKAAVEKSKNICSKNFVDYLIFTYNFLRKKLSSSFAKKLMTDFLTSIVFDAMIKKHNERLGPEILWTEGECIVNFLECSKNLGAVDNSMEAETTIQAKEEPISEPCTLDSEEEMSMSDSSSETESLHSFATSIDEDDNDDNDDDDESLSDFGVKVRNLRHIIWKFNDINYEYRRKIKLCFVKLNRISKPKMYHPYNSILE